MNYTYAFVPNADRTSQFHESKTIPFELEDLVMKDQYAILGERGNQITIVFDEDEAIALIDHLNRR